MKFGIVVFPGSNGDRDVETVTRGILKQPTRFVWHQETDIADLDLVVLPGGFSYGDYLRCGALARFSPVMSAVSEHARRGKLVLGICNGFQVLTESGLLPGALIRNRDLHFICDRVPVRVENTASVWTRGYRPRQVLALPIAHGEGLYHASEDTLHALEDNGQILFRYCSSEGESDDSSNPNGSLHNIAGIVNREGNVLGMMPHPERAAEAVLGFTDGVPLFEGSIAGVGG
jgi:phosphoribosylformylglycinamidine synthase